MSQTDLHQLSKKNQEFIRIAKHQLLENGKTEEEAESLIQEILPAIHENQGKEFQHGPFWSSNCLGELFQRERTL